MDIILFNRTKENHFFLKNHDVKFTIIRVINSMSYYLKISDSDAKRLISKLCKLNVISQIQYLIDQSITRDKIYLIYMLLLKGCKYSDPNTVQFLLNADNLLNNIILSTGLINNAIKRPDDDPSILELIWNSVKGYDFKNDHFETAICVGNLNILKLMCKVSKNYIIEPRLYSHQFVFSRVGIYRAIECDQYDVMEYLYKDMGCRLCMSHIDKIILHNRYELFELVIDLIEKRILFFNTKWNLLIRAKLMDCLDNRMIDLYSKKIDLFIAR
jgi:hypothetical protein